MSPKFLILVFFGCIFASVNAQVNIAVTAKYTDVVCSGSSTTVCEPLYCGAVGQSTCSSLGITETTPVQVRWGTPTDGNRNSKSGLGFTSPIPFLTNYDQDFFAGLMTHFNYPIYNAAKSVSLTLSLNITSQLNQNIAVRDFTFTLNIDETSNSGALVDCKYPSIVNPCADMISYPAGGFDKNSVFVVNGVNYTLQLKGFKESQSSTSLPLDSFVSQEKGSRNGYLFARITAACPNSCIGGGAVIISPAGTCVCDCTAASPCADPKTFAPDCSCVCSNSCGGGTVVPTDCSCNCASAPACPFPKIFSSSCGCVCPPNYCNQGSIDPSTCGCTCPPSLSCGTNFNLNATCLCDCPLTCQAPKVRVANPQICDCTCSTGCPTGWILNSTTCDCICDVKCPNGQIRNENNCTCGACVGNWARNETTTLCTICPLTTCTEPGARVDYDSCACVCSDLFCDLFNLGLVVNTTAFCECKPCSAGECICGNGILEVGEECDTGVVIDPCCNQCKYTTDACDDRNGCTINDICDGSGTCKGNYKCYASTTCANITCDPTVGTCDVNKQPDNSTCDSVANVFDRNLCIQRCYDGLCTPYPLTGPLAKDCSYDANPVDCLKPVCVPATGACELVKVDDGLPCSDGLACTSNDKCSNGTCVGVVKLCDDEVNVTQCQRPKCIEGGSSYICQAVPKTNGIRCNDGNNCTLVDICSNGACRSTGLVPRCPVDTTCRVWFCDPSNGACADIKFGNETTCNDGRNCTVNDRCLAGVCVGEETEETRALPECGFVPPPIENKSGDNALIIFAAAGGAALIGAIIGAALVIKKIQRSKLLDPQTWNPDTFSSVGTNPFFKASQNMVDNPLAE